MTTFQRPRWQAGLGVFALSTPAVLWILWGLVGRSLSPLEITGVVGAVATIVASFTRAFGSDQKETTSTSDHQGLDVASPLDLLAASPAVDKPDSPVTSESAPTVTKAVTNLKNSRSTTPATPRVFRETPIDRGGREVVLGNADASAAPTPSISTRTDSLRSVVASLSQNDTFIKEGAPALGEFVDRNKATHHQESTPLVRQLRWFGVGETVTVGTYAIKNAMIYVSEGKPLEDEASCVDLSLKVGKPTREPAGSLGYYPVYARLSPDQRANYLGWLSTGRVEPLHDIGYAFLFFYGLERRLLIEQQGLSPIVKETVRLLETYTFSGSFDGYLSRFLAFTLARSGIETLKDKWFDAVFAKSRLQRDEDFIAVALAWFFKKNAPLPFKWAIRIARQDPRCPRSIVLDRFPEQFVSLFEKRYRDRFGEGLILQTFLRDRVLAYRPASPSIAFDSEGLRNCAAPIRLPNILGLQSQFSPLAAIWSSCIEDLSAASRAETTEARAETLPDRPLEATTGTIMPPVAPAQKTDFRQPGRSKSLVGVADGNQTDRREKTERSARELRWYGKGEAVTVGTYQLKDPLVYVSVEHPLEEEASCIDLSLAVGSPVADPAGSLGYHSSYSDLTPSQRANYLRWLSGGRAEPLPEMGYAFVFFYGLERRLIVEQRDRDPIVGEALRLIETYPTSGSLDESLSRFLAFVLARDGVETIDGRWFEADAAKSRLHRNEDFLAIALAWFFKRNVPLPASWAMRVCRQDPRSPSSVIPDRFPEHLESLFEERYRRRFGEGLILGAPDRDLALRYRRVSPSALPTPCRTQSLWDSSGWFTVPLKIPNILGAQSQFSSLVEIWSSCIEELKPLSRVLGKGTEVGSREAFEALPDELKAKVEHPHKEKWDRVVTEHTNEDGCALLEISKLALIHGLEERAKLTPKQSQALAQTAGYVGLVIEPDARLTNRPYGWDDLVCLLRPEGQPGLPADSRYVGASLMLELGVYIAASDGTVEDVETDQVARFLESQFLLDPPDAQRLEALKRVFVARPPSLTGLGKRLQATLTGEQREAVGRFLTGIAAANGIIDRKEVSALRGAYRALDIGVEQLNSLLEEFRHASQEPIEVQRADQSCDVGETIPARPQARSDLGIRLDEGLLRRLMAETAEVTKMLAKAMRDESTAQDEGDQPAVSVAALDGLTGLPDMGDPALPEPKVARPMPGPATSVEERSLDRSFDGLDIRFHGMLSRLLTAPVWSKTDFDSLARNLQLMPAGALDAVNSWAYELFDDPIIIEQGDDLHIQSYLIEGQP